MFGERHLRVWPDISIFSVLFLGPSKCDLECGGLEGAGLLACQLRAPRVFLELHKVDARNTGLPKPTPVDQGSCSGSRLMDDKGESHSERAGTRSMDKMMFLLPKLPEMQ